MKVALLGSTAWFDEELTRFSQIAVGFIAEGVPIVQVLPEVLDDDASDAFAGVVTWPESRCTLVNHRRLRDLAPALQTHEPQLLHVLDGRLWQPGLRLARALNVPALLTIGSRDDLAALPRIARAAAAGDPPFTLAARTQPLLDAAREQLSNAAPVELCAPGVHAADTPRAAQRGPGAAVCVAVAGDGQLDAYTDALLQGVARVIDRFPRAQFFFDGIRDDQQALYRQARALNLLSQVSFAPRRIGHRELLLKADLFVHPQPLGRARGLILQAMAQGVPVLAQDDPWVDYLHDQVTCWRVDAPDPVAWTTVLERAIVAPQQAAELGAAAWNWARLNRSLAHEVDQTLDLYRRVTGTHLKLDPAKA